MINPIEKARAAAEFASIQSSEATKAFESARDEYCKNALDRLGIEGPSHWLYSREWNKAEGAFRKTKTGKALVWNKSEAKILLEKALKEERKLLNKQSQHNTEGNA